MPRNCVISSTKKWLRVPSPLFWVPQKSNLQTLTKTGSSFQFFLPERLRMNKVLTVSSALAIFDDLSTVGFIGQTNEIANFAAHRNSIRPAKWSEPTNQPSALPSRQPSSQPTEQPSIQPSSYPSGQPTTHPSGFPTSQSLRDSQRPDFVSAK